MAVEEPEWDECGDGVPADSSDSLASWSASICAAACTMASSKPSPLIGSELHPASTCGGRDDGARVQSSEFVLVKNDKLTRKALTTGLEHSAMAATDGLQ